MGLIDAIVAGASFGASVIEQGTERAGFMFDDDVWLVKPTSLWPIACNYKN